MNRPSLSSDGILRAVAEKVMEQMPTSIGMSNDDIEVIELAISNEAPVCDEYRMARHLDRHGWDCDMSVIEALSVTSGEVYDALREATKTWVTSNQIKPRLKIGDVAKVMLYEGRGPKKEYEGEVVRIDADLATYTICVPAIGHVKEGVGTHGVLIPYEDLHPLATPVEEFEMA